MTIENLFEWVASAAQMIVRGLGEQHNPTLVLLKAGLQPADVIGIVIEQDKHKDWAGPGIGAMLSNPEVEGYIFISEAWLVIRDKNEPRVATARLEHEPDRIEIITAEIGLAHGPLFTKTWRIDRDRSNQLVPFEQHGPMELDDPERPRRRLTDFFRWATRKETRH